MYFWGNVPPAFTHNAPRKIARALCDYNHWTNPQQKELEKAKREIGHLRERLQKTELIIEVQNKLTDTWSRGRVKRREQMIQEAKDLAEEVGISETCKTLGIPRSTFYFV